MMAKLNNAQTSESVYKVRTYHWIIEVCGTRFQYCHSDVWIL